jgi:hypothetical protein
MPLACFSPHTTGPCSARSLLRGVGPSAWPVSMCGGLSSAARPYRDCRVTAWDLTPGVKQGIREWLDAKCGAATLQDDPCSPWRPEDALFSEADVNAR